MTATPAPWTALPAPAALGHPDGTWLVVGPRGDNGEPHTIAVVMPCDDGTHPGRVQADAQLIAAAFAECQESTASFDTGWGHGDCPCRKTGVHRVHRCEHGTEWWERTAQDAATARTDPGEGDGTGAAAQTLSGGSLADMDPVIARLIGRHARKPLAGVQGDARRGLVDALARGAAAGPLRRARDVHRARGERRLRRWRVSDELVCIEQFEITSVYILHGRQVQTVIRDLDTDIRYTIAGGLVVARGLPPEPVLLDVSRDPQQHPRDETERYIDATGEDR